MSAGALTLGSLADGLASGISMRRQEDDRKKTSEQQDRLLSLMEAQAKLAPSGLGSGAVPALGSPGTGSAAMPSGEVADYVRSGLVKRGVPQHIADGTVLNWGDESGMDPTAVGDDGNAYGLGQWNGPRKTALFDFAKQNNVDPASPDTQMDFYMSEMNGPESSAWKRAQATKTAGQAAVAILNHYERPAESYRVKRASKYSAYDAGAGMGATRPVY